MKVFFKFTLSLISLPFLVPWHVSEKFFMRYLQPKIFKKFHLPEYAQKPQKRKKHRFVWTLIPILLLFYLAITYNQFVISQGSVKSAFNNPRVLFYMIYNDFATMVNAFFSPVNTLIVFSHGAEVSLGAVILSLYLIFLPLVFIFNLGFCFIHTRLTLQHAIALRNEADKDIHIVAYSESGAEDEIFFGIEATGQGAPFYAKTDWIRGHIQVIGSPGSGKTLNILQPLWFQSVRRNVPTLVLDGKASQKNIDRFYTIASSLAQGHEIVYFNPFDPERSAMYNPLLRGTVEEVKKRILSSLNWSQYSSSRQETLDYCLNIILHAIRSTGKSFTFYEILKYFESKTYVANQLGKVTDEKIRNGLADFLQNYNHYQKDTAFFSSILWEICQSDYAWLLETRAPELDIYEAFQQKRDCYISLPMGADDTAMTFLAQTMMGDILAAYHHLALNPEFTGSAPTGFNGLLIIDEFAKFANRQFIELLRTARILGVSVCYTNQSLTELENPDLHLDKSFLDQLAEHTNVIFSFNLSGPETTKAILERMGMAKAASMPASSPANKAQKSQGLASGSGINPQILRQLQPGQCVVFVRHPRVLKLLKTGRFKFNQLMQYERQEGEAMVSQA
ncbi:MAG: hypothetical protein D6814_04560 [Calditrichaeota bacterium]|nr:MAG: hypothetical protein D6814_04560 [Calditrichota bacterium]